MNASNLLDIGHALEALNITQEQRATLEAGTSDALGTILEALKTAIDSDISSIGQQISTINSELENKGNCVVEYGSYVGNGQSGLNSPNSIKFSISPRFVFVFVDRSINSPRNAMGVFNIYGLDESYSASYFLIDFITSNNGCFSKYVSSTNTLSWYYSSGSNESVQMNVNNTRYYWYALA